MHIDAMTGLLIEAQQLPSPNCDDRPLAMEPNLIVIHGISLPPGEFGGPWIDALFTNTLDPNVHPYFKEIQALKVSSHLLIRREGKIIQYVPFHRRAWHAGQSSFQGCADCNNFGIGIELEGADTVPYTDIQYQQLVAVITALTQIYHGITRDRIVGHADIAPGRKTDPGTAFNWQRLWRLLQLYTESH